MAKKELTIKESFLELKQVQDDFFETYGVNDIYSNSKIYEILIADSLDHTLIPGHSGSKDAKDSTGEYEYKHYKEKSSNHSWTFNDFSDSTITNLKSIEAVIFAYIDDTQFPPNFSWYFKVPGNIISKYLETRTVSIKNTRKMINVGPKQIEDSMQIQKTVINQNLNGRYSSYLTRIFEIINHLENKLEVRDLLTSNKFWEVLISAKLGHKVLSEQLGHDAVDLKGNFYEYKVSKTFSWNFQDISDKVLKKYEGDKLIILAVVNKETMEIVKLYAAEPKYVITRLKEKLEQKKSRYKEKGGLRRLQVSLSKGDLALINANELL